MQDEKDTKSRAVVQSDAYLDCRGQRCPMPIVRLSQAMKQLPAGQSLTIDASDPAFGSDLRAWVEAMGFELVEFVDGPVQKAVIRKP